jgi:hypothetical protein
MNELMFIFWVCAVVVIVTVIEFKSWKRRKVSNVQSREWGEHLKKAVENA